jgi:hypothetical protein
MFAVSQLQDEVHSWLRDMFDPLSEAFWRSGSVETIQNETMVPTPNSRALVKVSSFIISRQVEVQGLLDLIRGRSAILDDVWGLNEPSYRRASRLANRSGRYESRLERDRCGA